MVTILTESGEHAVAGAEASGETLWCPAREAQAATGWEAKPEGLCHGPTCVPLPAAELVALVGEQPEPRHWTVAFSGRRPNQSRNGALPSSSRKKTMVVVGTGTERAYQSC